MGKRETDYPHTISFFVSEPINREVRDVLNRAELRRKLPGINDRIVNAFLTKLGQTCGALVNRPVSAWFNR